MTTTVRAMVRFAAATGCRPMEACLLRPRDLDRTDADVWIFSPMRHECEHHDQARRVFVGTKAQAAILPLLDRDPETFVFSPAESVNERRAMQRANRKIPVQPSQRNRSQGVQTFAERYDTNSFRKAIRHAVAAANKTAKKADSDAAEIPVWSPNMLRHLAAMTITREHGVEHARAILGHATIDATKHYLERDAELARRVAAVIG